MIQIGDQVERVSVDRLEAVLPVNAGPTSATQIPMGMQMISPYLQIGSRSPRNLIVYHFHAALPAQCIKIH